MRHYLLISILIPVIFLVAGCTLSPPVRTELTPQIFKDNLTKKYSYTKNYCYDAVIKSFEEFEIEIQKENKDEGVIISKRKRSNFQTWHRTSTAGSSTTTYGVEEIFQKYYFKVAKAENNTCEILLYRWRLWTQSGETKSLNVDWAKKQYWNPIYIEIENQLYDNI